ncbi:MAG: GAF domain-containing protein, partial [Chloroflexota bacterium]|nr:GAF domain-containing protein [Chloroflexota bacterium]
VSERSVLRTADYLQDESFPHTAAADDFARRVGITSVIAAPLVAGPAVFGVLGIYASRAEAFGDRQVGLAGALADHAAAAIAQSRLIADLAASRVELERRIRSEQTLRDITARIAAIRDPRDVLHRIADKTRRLLGCDAVHLMLMDDDCEYLTPGVVIGTLDEATRTWSAATWSGQRPARSAAWSGETVTTADYEADPRIPHGEEDTRAAQRMGICAMAVVPLRAAETEVLGALATTYRRPQEISREHRELLEALASQASVAVHNSRLYERLRASEAKYRLQVEHSPDLVFTTDAEGRLTYLSDACERMTGWTTEGLLCEPFWVLVDRTARDEVVGSLERTREDHDLEQRIRFPLLRLDGSTIPVEVNATGLTAEGRFRGIHGATRDLSVTDRLEAERRRQAADLAAAEERAHLARELHDSVTQALFSMTLTTRTVELLLRRDPAEARRQVTLLKELQRDALAEMRALIFALRPGSLEKDGLLQALRTYAAAVEQRSGLSVSVESSIDERLAPDLEDALFRVGQDARVIEAVSEAYARKYGEDASVGRMFLPRARRSTLELLLSPAEGDPIQAALQTP